MYSASARSINFSGYLPANPPGSDISQTEMISHQVDYIYRSEVPATEYIYPHVFIDAVDRQVALGDVLYPRPATGELQKVGLTILGHSDSLGTAIEEVFYAIIRHRMLRYTLYHKVICVMLQGSHLFTVLMISTIPLTIL